MLILFASVWTPADPPGDSGGGKTIELPDPERTGSVPLERVLNERRSVRELSGKALTLPQLSQLLWASQGLTRGGDHRASPSAGALYPLEVYVATAEGLHHYRPSRHRMRRVSERDPRPLLYRAALRQEAVRDAPAVFTIAAVPARTTAKYGLDRGRRYVLMEAGHAAQNLLLQATALGLGGVPVGAFRDADVRDVLDLPADQEPLYLVPVGRPH